MAKTKLDLKIAKQKNYVIYVHEYLRGFYVTAKVGKIRLALHVTDKNSKSLLQVIEKANKSLTAIEHFKLKTPKDYDHFLAHTSRVGSKAKMPKKWKFYPIRFKNYNG